MSRKSLIFVPTSAALVDQTLHTDSGTDTDTACSRQWKKTKSSGVARGNEFIASSRVHPKPEGSEEESGRNIEAGTAPPSTVCAGATTIATAVTTTAEDLPEKKEEEEEAEASLDFCEVESDNVHAQAPLLFHYRGVQREYALHKEGPSDISEIFSRAISIMNDSDSASSHSLISVLDSQQGNGSGSGSGSGSGNNNNGNGLPKEKVLETRLIQVCIPEHKVVKMTVFSPLQTIGSFVGTLLDSISKGEEPEDYQMVFPIFLSDSISAFTLDSRSAFGIYGIGMKADEVPPTLFLFRRTRDNIYDLPKYDSFVGLKASSQEDVRADAWLKVLTNWSALTPGPLTLSLVRETITKMAVAGIPAGVRGWAWRQVSGCFTIANENPGLYADLLAQALQSPPPYMRRINVDLARSLPRHPFFASKDSFGQPALKRVLLAFGQYERSIGYCQGINFIAAALLCYMDEEIINKYHMKNFYTDGIKLLRSTLVVFRTLLAEDLPDLAKFLNDNLIPIDVFVPAWFQSMFAGVDLNFHIVVRIWDMFFLEGLPFLYKVSLALLEMLKDVILQSGVEKAMKILQLRKGCTDTLIDPTALIERATKIKTRQSMDPTNKEYHG